MNRTTTALFTVVTLLAACGPKAADNEGAEGGAAVTEETGPKVPRVYAIQIGRMADSTGVISAVKSLFEPTDTVVVSVGTENALLGSKVEVHLRKGAVEVATANGLVPTADAAGKARLPLSLAPTKPWAIGDYSVEVMLDGTSQGIQEFKVAKP